MEPIPHCSGSHVEKDALIPSLLEKSSGELASWMLEQVSSMSDPDMELENAPVFHLALEVAAARPEVSQQLTRTAIWAVNTLPASDRAAVVQLAMGLQLQVGAIEQPKKDIVSSVSAASFVCDVDVVDVVPSVASATLLQNLQKIADASKIREMSPTDVAEISRVAKSEAAILFEPAGLCDLVRALDPASRKQLSNALITAELVKEDARAALEETVRPGGYADKLSSVLKLGNFLWKWSIPISMAPFLEFCQAIFLWAQGYGCAEPLRLWLLVDAISAGIAVCALGLAMSWATPAYKMITKDPRGVATRWNASRDSKTWESAVEQTLPGVNTSDIRDVGIALAIWFVMVLLTICWCLAGIVWIIAAAFVGCSKFTHVVAILCVLLRTTLVCGTLIITIYTLREVSKYCAWDPPKDNTEGGSPRKDNTKGGSAAPLLAEPLSGSATTEYGTA